MPDFNPKYGQDIKEINEKVKESSLFVQQINKELSKVIVGQKYMIDRLLVALLANGHILIEGVPGLAKTLAVKTLAKCVQTKFQRIQFTPDLL
ncbi:MAG: AAA family ATPase, partial [Candidatus Omnitrophica bacterium]|nr:AAA family ATPase [Candidatus Omnitrophota bacterium]